MTDMHEASLLKLLSEDDEKENGNGDPEEPVDPDEPGAPDPEPEPEPPPETIVAQFDLRIWQPHDVYGRLNAFGGHGITYLEGAPR